MAGETYYFLFSVCFVILVPLALGNAWSAVSKGQTIFGASVTPKSPGYKKFKNLSSRQGVLIGAALELLFIMGLADSIRRIIKISNQGYTQGMLIFGSLAMVVLIYKIVLYMKDKTNSK